MAWQANRLLASLCCCSRDETERLLFVRKKRGTDDGMRRCLPWVLLVRVLRDWDCGKTKDKLSDM